MYSPAVTTLGIDNESGMLADWVRIMIVVTFPGIVVIMEDEMPGEKKHFWTNFTALAHPFAM